MKKKLILVVLALTLTAAPAHAMSVQRYDCDISQGVNGLLKDYFATNGLVLLQLLWKVLPQFTTGEALAPDATAEVDPREIGYEVSALGVGVAQKLDLAAITHLFCFEVVP